MGFESCRGGPRDRTGVTLLELLVVLTILGALAALSGTLVSGQIGYLRSRSALESVEQAFRLARSLARSRGNPAIEYGVCLIPHTGDMESKADASRWWIVVYSDGPAALSLAATDRLPARPPDAAWAGQPPAVRAGARPLGPEVVLVTRYRETPPVSIGVPIFVQYDRRGAVIAARSTLGSLSRADDFDGDENDSYEVDGVDPASGWMRLRIPRAGPALLSGWNGLAAGPATVGSDAF